MMTLKQFLMEKQTVEAVPSDFTVKQLMDSSSTTKDHIRMVIAKHYDIPSEVFGRMQKHFTAATTANFKDRVNKFIEAFPEESKRMSFDKQISGIGPGEVLIYFLFNNTSIGGPSAGMDILVNDEPFAEVKSGTYMANKNTVGTFKLLTRGSVASTKTFDDFDAFNTVYSQLQAENLPAAGKSEKSKIQWRGGKEVSHEQLKAWAKIDLNDLEATPEAKQKGEIKLKLFKSGDILRKDEKIANIKDDTAKNVLAVLKDLLDIHDVDTHNKDIDVNDISTVDKIHARYAENVMKEYAKDKTFCIFQSTGGSRPPKIAHFGKLNKKAIRIYNTHDGNVFAELKLDEL